MNRTIGKLIKTILCVIMLTGIFSLSAKTTEALDYDLELDLRTGDKYGEFTFADFTTEKTVKLKIASGDGTVENYPNTHAYGFSSKFEAEDDCYVQYLTISVEYGGTETLEFKLNGADRKATLKLTSPVKVAFNPYGGSFPDGTTVNEYGEHEVLPKSDGTLPYIPEASWKGRFFAGWYDLDDIELDENRVYTTGTCYYAKWYVTIPVQKVWEDGNDYNGIRPDSVTLKLYDIIFDTGKEITLYPEDGWAGEFTDVECEPSSYFSVFEVTDDVITGKDGPGTYAVKTDGSGTLSLIVTNTHTPLRTINVNIDWDDKNDRDKIRPESVEIALCIGENEFDRITLSIENEWKGAFENVPVFEDEKEIDYTVKEIETDALNGNNAEGSYSVVITGNMNDGFIITNIHKTETTPSYEIPKTGIE